jgi:phosphatidylinositol 3-kinase
MIRFANFDNERKLTFLCLFKKVREYAIDTLASAPDAELRLYLLQLVQAIKYETTESSDCFSPNAACPTQDKHSTRPVSSLTTFLIDRAAKNIELANYLYW